MQRSSAISAAFVCLLGAAPLPAQINAQFDAGAWREDVRVIARELPARHPNAFFRIARAQWDSAVAATEQRMATLTNRPQALVALMQLVAFVRDGHTSINPLFDRAARVRFFPIELYLFDDGLFVRSAAPEYANLVGARILQIGNATSEQAMAAVGRIIPHENEWWLKRWGPAWLNIGEILAGLGLTDDPQQMPLVIERDGRRQTVTVRVAGSLQPAGHNPNGGIDRSGWKQMRDDSVTPMWLRNPGQPYWAEYDAADQTLYVSYRAVVTQPPPANNEAFWRDVFARIDSIKPARLVIDMRENTGGNSFFNKQVVRGIVARPQIDRADKLFVIVGGRTFSAAMNLARDLEQWTNATFVGEPTGNAAYFFGDHVQVHLPVSGLTVNISSLTWPPYDPRDRREFLAPAIYTPLTSGDYRANVDPAMRAILMRAKTPSTAARVEEALRNGDLVAAERVVQQARADVSSRFRTPESEVNALGYRLLRAGQKRAAISVFGINTRVFPQSANVWDSLGEALLEDGQRDASITAYRQALSIDPGFVSSRQALDRLGVR